MRIVQIGCNNCEDHVFDFVSKNKDLIEVLIVVDPLEKCVHAAQEKYQFLSERLIVVQCAISENNAIEPFFCPADDDMSLVASLSVDHIFAHHFTGFIPVGKIKTLWVPCLTINCFLESFVSLQAGIDRLYIDTEGHDGKILLGLDLNRFKIPWIQYESMHIDGPFNVGERSVKVKQKLESSGYTLEVIDFCSHVVMNVVAKK